MISQLSFAFGAVGSVQRSVISSGDWINLRTLSLVQTYLTLLFAGALDAVRGSPS